MLYLSIAIIGVLLTIFFVIGTHEAAHFLTARLLGIKVLRFSIGFGKTLVRFHDKHQTEYVIALVPLGGYVKMLDENEGPVAPSELPHAFNRQPFYKKFLVVLAGPLCNIFCAVVLYWIIFMIGFTTVKPIIGEVTPHSIAAMGGLKPNEQIISVDNTPTNAWPGIIFRLLVHAGNEDTLDIAVMNKDKKIVKHTLNLTNWHMDELTPDPLGSLGIKAYQPDIPLVIGIMTKDSPALKAGLIVGDKIVLLNNKPVKDWQTLTQTISAMPGEEVTLTIQRENQLKNITVKVGAKEHFWSKTVGFLGIAPKFKWPPQLLQTIKYSPLKAIPRALQEVKDFSYFNFILFGKIITGKLSLQSLGGPITIFESAGDALNYGFLSFIAFLAFLSISIGIINLLPIPGLDGGHLVIFIIEAIIRKPLPINVLLLLYRLGFILVLFVLVQAFINDILRL